MTAITIGVDVGKVHDPTAIAVAEVVPYVHAGHVEDTFAVRHLERLPLGTAYPQVAERVAAIVAGVCRRTPRVALYVDATGVGRPLVDLLDQAGVNPRAVYFVAGDGLVVRPDGSISLGKGRLVSRLQALLRARRLALPHTAEGRVLASELLTYEMRVARDGAATFGAIKAGTHDDIVTAVGLAVLDIGRGPHTAQQSSSQDGGVSWDQSQSA